MTKEAQDGAIVLVMKQGNRIVQLGLNEEQRKSFELFLSAMSKESPLKSLPKEFDLHHNPTVLLHNNELSNYLEQINNIMWETFMIKDRPYTREDGLRIVKVLEKWAEKY